MGTQLHVERTCVRRAQVPFNEWSFRCSISIPSNVSMSCHTLPCALPSRLVKSINHSSSSFCFCFVIVSTFASYTFSTLYSPPTFYLSLPLHNTECPGLGPLPLTLRWGFACRRFLRQACLEQHVQGKEEAGLSRVRSSTLMQLQEQLSQGALELS